MMKNPLVLVLLAVSVVNAQGGMVHVTAMWSEWRTPPAYVPNPVYNPPILYQVVVMEHDGKIYQTTACGNQKFGLIVGNDYKITKMGNGKIEVVAIYKNKEQKAKFCIEKISEKSS